MKNLLEMAQTAANELGVLQPTELFKNPANIYNKLWSDIIYDALNILNKELNSLLENSEDIVWDYDTFESRSIIHSETDIAVFDEYLVIELAQALYRKAKNMPYATYWSKYDTHLQQIKKDHNIGQYGLQEGHLYKQGTNTLYYVSKWNDGEEQQIMVEVFTQCDKPNENLFEDDLFKDNFQLKTIEEFKEYIGETKLVDLGLLENTLYKFERVPGFGRNTDAILVSKDKYSEEDLWRAKLERQRMVEVLEKCKPVIVAHAQELYSKYDIEYEEWEDIIKEIDEWIRK